MNFIWFLIPLTLMAGLAKSEATYTAPNLPANAPDLPILEQTIDIPSFDSNSQPTPKITPNKPITEKSEPIECSCVLYAENITGVKLKLDAIDYPINTIEPKVGDLIKLQYYNATTTKFTYHLSVIKEITEEGDYSVKEANFEKCKEGERVIPKNDEHILGFFNPARQKLIDELTPIQRETLWNESGWSHYDTKGAVLRGKDGEWGVAQFMPTSWKWLSQLRRSEDLSMLDKMSFEHQIIMFKYGWSKNVKWYGRPTSSE